MMKMANDFLANAQKPQKIKEASEKECKVSSMNLTEFLTIAANNLFTEMFAKEF